METMLPSEGKNRGAWIIAGAIVIAALLIVIALAAFRAQDRKAECDRLFGMWQNAPASTPAVDEFTEWQSLGCADE